MTEQTKLTKQQIYTRKFGEGLRELHRKLRALSDFVDADATYANEEFSTIEWLFIESIDAVPCEATESVVFNYMNGDISFDEMQSELDVITEEHIEEWRKEDALNLQKGE